MVQKSQVFCQKSKKPDLRSGFDSPLKFSVSRMLFVMLHVMAHNMMVPMGLMKLGSFCLGGGDEQWRADNGGNHQEQSEILHMFKSKTRTLPGGYKIPLEPGTKLPSGRRNPGATKVENLMDKSLRLVRLANRTQIGLYTHGG